MGLVLRPSPCWIGLWQGPDVFNDLGVGGHYDTAGQVPSFDEHPGRACRHLGCGGVVTFGIGGGYCTWCQAEGLAESGWEERDYLPGRLDVPCLQMVCDGDCGESLGDEDGTPYCLASLAGAQRTAARDGWLVTDDGAVWCPADRPAGLVVPPTADELEESGQQRLPLDM
jgi:hypothetical protein